MASQNQNVREGIVAEIYKPARKHYKRRGYIITKIDETFSADLVEMQKYAKFNNGYRYILTVIDHFSKYAFAVPLKTKTGPEVTRAMKSVFDQGRIPSKLLTDEGKEFFNRDFQSLLKQYKIHHYTTFSGMKAPIIERWNRTLKTKMWPKFDLNGNVKWVSLLKTLVDEYNHTRHRTIKTSPADVNKDNEQEIYKNVYAKPKIVSSNPKFKVGDFVRISKRKLLFEKGYSANFSMEVFKIVKAKLSNPRTYLLEDLHGKEVKGAFYTEELQKTKYPDTYLIEKILKRKKDKLYVKWLGFEKPSWVQNKDIV